MLLSNPNAEQSLKLTDSERAELIRVLDDYLSETHLEARRTDNPEYRTGLHKEEAVLRSILEKLQRLE